MEAEYPQTLRDEDMGSLWMLVHYLLKSYSLVAAVLKGMHPSVIKTQ